MTFRKTWGLFWPKYTTKAAYLAAQSAPGAHDITVVVPTITAYNTPVTPSATIHNSTGGTIGVVGVVWSLTGSSDVATIDPTTGSLTVLMDGVFSVVATSPADGRSGSAAVTVALSTTPESMTVTPNPVSVSEGATVQLVPVVRNAAGGIIPGATVTYTALDATHDTVSNTGLITGVLATSGAGAGVRVTSGSVVVDVPVTVVGAIAALVGDFNALDGTGTSNMVVGYDTKLGPAPTLGVGNTRVSALPPAYKKSGIAADMILLAKSADRTGDYSPGIGWDNTLKEINTRGGATGDLTSTLDSALRINKAFTIWVAASFERPIPSGLGATSPLTLLTNSGNAGNSTGSQRCALEYRDGLSNTYLSSRVMTTAGQEASTRSQTPDTTDGTVRFFYFGADPATGLGWIGSGGDEWQALTPANASYVPAADAMGLCLTYFRECIVRGWWYSDGKPKPSQVQRMASYASGLRGTPKVTLQRLTLLGNSYIAGTGASDDAHSFAGLVTAASTPNAVRTLGYPGETWEQIDADGGPIADYTVNGDRTYNDLLIFEGVNAYGGGNLYNRMLTFLNNRKLGGTYRKIWVATLFPCNVTASDGYVAMNAYNQAVRDGAAANGYLVCDWGADPLLGSTSNGAYIAPDGLHPNDAGHQKMKDIFTAAGGLV